MRDNTDHFCRYGLPFGTIFRLGQFKVPCIAFLLPFSKNIAVQRPLGHRGRSSGNSVAVRDSSIRTIITRGQRRFNDPSCVHRCVQMCVNNRADYCAETYGSVYEWLVADTANRFESTDYQSIKMQESTMVYGWRSQHEYEVANSLPIRRSTHTK